MEGAHPNRAAGRQPLDAAAHLLGRFVGEGEGENLVVGDALGQELGDAMGNDAGLSAAWPGENQQGAVEVQHGLALGVGQVLQEFRSRAVGQGGMAEDTEQRIRGPMLAVSLDFSHHEPV